MESIPTDIAAWFASSAALAAVIVALVAFVKKNLIPTLTGIATVFVSLGLGAAAGLIGHFAGYLTDGITPALMFGVSAGFLASGGWDAIAGLMGKREPAE